MTDKDGNTYKTVKIGKQEWMAENLNVSHFRNGDPIPEAKNRKEWQISGKESNPVWCYYENDPKNGKEYGKLYNGFAVNDPRGLAPKGWHIPTDDEWTTLTDYLGGTSVAGGKLKEIGTTHWAKPNTDATNETGFTALPSGWFRAIDGFFIGIGYTCGWWSSTEHILHWASGVESARDAFLRSLSYKRGNVQDAQFDEVNFGFSVRCLRDYRHFNLLTKCLVLLKLKK